MLRNYGSNMTRDSGNYSKLSCNDYNCNGNRIATRKEGDEVRQLFYMYVVAKCISLRQIISSIEVSVFYVRLYMSATDVEDLLNG